MTDRDFKNHIGTYRGITGDPDEYVEAWILNFDYFVGIAGFGDTEKEAKQRLINHLRDYLDDLEKTI
jgi:hypothetical protein